MARTIANTYRILSESEFDLRAAKLLRFRILEFDLRAAPVTKFQND